jgi:hypothetical protein
LKITGRTPIGASLAPSATPAMIAQPRPANVNSSRTIAMTTSSTSSGGCLCGGVAFHGRGAPQVKACHCQMCRRWHGGPAVSVDFADGIAIDSGAENIAWYRSSEWAERGFCRVCGSTLFYRLIGAPDLLSGEAGAFVLPPGLAITEHFFIDEKPDYYDFTGDAPRLTGAEVFARYAPEDKP